MKTCQSIIFLNSIRLKNFLMNRKWKFWIFYTDKIIYLLNRLRQQSTLKSKQQNSILRSWSQRAWLLTTYTAPHKTETKSSWHGQLNSPVENTCIMPRQKIVSKTLLRIFQSLKSSYSNRKDFILTQTSTMKSVPNAYTKNPWKLCQLQTHPDLGNAYHVIIRFHQKQHAPLRLLNQREEEVLWTVVKNKHNHVKAAGKPLFSGLVDAGRKRNA